MNGVRDVLVLVLAWSGALFVLLASIGVLRMPDVFARMHASSKAATLGAACSVLAAAFHFGQSENWFRSLALGVFLFLTAPIAAHLIARAAFVTRAPLARDTVLNEAATYVPDACAPGDADQEPSKPVDDEANPTDNSEPPASPSAHDEPAGPR